MKLFCSMLKGAFCGAGANALLMLVYSYALHLGYCAVCFAPLEETFGGELNAAAAQTATIMFAGALIGSGKIFRYKPKKNLKTFKKVLTKHGKPC